MSNGGVFWSGIQPLAGGYHKGYSSLGSCFRLVVLSPDVVPSLTYTILLFKLSSVSGKC